MNKPEATIQRTIYITWEEALESLEEIKNDLGIGIHGDLFDRNDINRLRNLANFIEREIEEYEEAIKENQEG